MSEGGGPTPIELVLGPNDYLYGEGKALLEVIEGRDAMPREALFFGQRKATITLN